MTNNLDLANLKHITLPLPHGGKVVILDPGAVIDAEATAMLQALHSRSTGGISHHLEVLAKNGPENFMRQFYVGYGHKSIGDCGTAVVFVEGVSILAAKAIQDNVLYNGQEASTRFIDFSEQLFHDPVGSIESAKILKAQRTLYMETQEQLIPFLTYAFPQKSSDGADNTFYEKAIRARSFDIARSLLPGGVSTNLAWASTLRLFADHIALLRHHPLLEVRNIAFILEEALQEAYPSSFDSTHRYQETEKYNKDLMRNGYYYTNRFCPEFAVTRDSIDRTQLMEYRTYLETRPNRETELPRFITECGDMQLEFLLDFGSFRDIQRHRAVTQRMPLLTLGHGFEPWYLDQMPPELREKVSTTLARTEKAIQRMAVSPATTQYYIPMGYRVPNRLTGGLHGLVYLAELRARTTVHPTLQIRAHQMAHELNERFGTYGLTVHTDEVTGMFDVKRGKHDIIKK